jgi:hypothetical protein
VLVTRLSVPTRLDADVLASTGVTCVMVSRLVLPYITMARNGAGIARWCPATSV